MQKNVAFSIYIIFMLIMSPATIGFSFGQNDTSDSTEETTTEEVIEENPAVDVLEETVEEEVEETPAEEVIEEVEEIIEYDEEDFKGGECDATLQYCFDSSSCTGAGGYWCNDVFCSGAPCDQEYKEEYELPEECKGISPEECAQKLGHETPPECEGLNKDECSQVMKDLYGKSEEGKQLPPECTGYSPEECEGILKEKYGDDFTGQLPVECEGLAAHECKEHMEGLYGKDFNEDIPGKCEGLSQEECKKLMDEKYGSNFAGMMPQECKGLPPKECGDIMRAKYGDDFHGAREDFRREDRGERREGFPTEIPLEIIEAGAEQQYIDMMCIMTSTHMGQFLSISDVIVAYFDLYKNDPDLGFLDIDTSAIVTMKETMESAMNDLCDATPENFQIVTLKMQEVIEGDNGMEFAMQSIMDQIQTQLMERIQILMQDPIANQAQMQGIQAKMEVFGPGLRDVIDGAMVEGEFTDEQKQEMAEKEYSLFLTVMNYHLTEIQQRKAELEAEGINVTALNAALEWMQAKLTEGKSVFHPDTPEAEKEAFISSLTQGFETQREQAEDDIHKQKIEHFIVKAEGGLVQVEQGLELAKEQGMNVGALEVHKRKAKFYIQKAKEALAQEDYEAAMKNLRLAKVEFNKIKKLWDNLNTAYKARRVVAQ